MVHFVTGAGDPGSAVVNHPLAAKIAFTGSTAVGKAIQRALAGTGKRLTLELGGKAANIVFDDAPIDQAVEGIVKVLGRNDGLGTPAMTWGSDSYSRYGTGHGYEDDDE